MLFLLRRALWEKLAESFPMKTSQWKCIGQKIYLPENDIHLHESSFRWSCEEFTGKHPPLICIIPSAYVSANEDQTSIALIEILA